MESILAITLSVIALIGVFFQIIRTAFSSGKETQNIYNNMNYISKEQALLKESLVGTIKLIETKHDGEVKRNDDIIQLINAEAKTTAFDQKAVVQRLTILETELHSVMKDVEMLCPKLKEVENQCIRTQTICEQCIGRSFGCDSEDKK